MGEHPLDKQLLIRVAQADLDDLADTAGRFGDDVKKAAVARAALRIGLGLLREDPAKLLHSKPREF